MKPLPNPFRPKAIINLLCRYRIRAMAKGREKKLQQSLTSETETRKKLTYKDGFFDQLCALLPPRKKWSRPRLARRKLLSDPIESAFLSIKHRVITTHLKVKAGEIDAPAWYERLCTFILLIQSSVNDSHSFEFSKPYIIPAVKKRPRKIGDKTICRALAIFNLRDRVIISLSAKYCLKEFDCLFHDCSLAFKPVKFLEDKPVVIKHHEAIIRLRSFKTLTTGKAIYVAECDLDKFFDTVNHNIALSAFLRGVHCLEQQGIYFDKRIITIYIAYLNCYSFIHDVLKLNKDKIFFLKRRIANGEFDYPLQKLHNKFYPRDQTHKRRIGIPQGGALSCFIANLLLHDADEQIFKPADQELLYQRYCDDMIIMHTSKTHADRVLHTYIKATQKLRLLVHSPIVISGYYKEDGNSGKLYWTTKTKSPYLWSDPRKDSTAIPWISFVGYQINYKGEVRVRKSSLEKETAKQKKLRKSISAVLKVHNKAWLCDHSNKTFDQHIHSVNSRLSSMAVGKIDLDKIGNQGAYCWSEGFSQLTANKIALRQLRGLDKHRNLQIGIFRRQIAPLIGVKKETKEKKKGRRFPDFYGMPFSYYNFLKKKSNSS
jgi:Reverse transcriptase (RNA-dependent DNA polymerase)